MQVHVAAFIVTIRKIENQKLSVHLAVILSVNSKAPLHVSGVSPIPLTQSRALQILLFYNYLYSLYYK